jgi:hypothetical protein
MPHKISCGIFLFSRYLAENINIDINIVLPYLTLPKKDLYSKGRITIANMLKKGELFMKRFLKTGLLLLFMLALSIPALAAPQNWERIYPDAPNIYLDTNSVAKPPEGDIILFVERTDFSAPYYQNRAFELETIAYMPRTSEWRGFHHAYYDINRNLLEQHKYSLQTTPWTKVSPNDAVIKRVMEIANGDSVAIIKPPTGNQPSSTGNNANTGAISREAGTYFKFEKVEGYGSYKGGNNAYVRRIDLTNLVCKEPSFSQTGRVSIETRAGKVFDIWIDSKNQGDNYGTSIMTHYIKVLYNGDTVFVGKPFHKKRALDKDSTLPIPDITAIVDESQDKITMQVKYKDGSMEEFFQPAFGANALKAKITSSFIEGNIQLTY